MIFIQAMLCKCNVYNFGMKGYTGHNENPITQNVRNTAILNKKSRELISFAPGTKYKNYMFFFIYLLNIKTNRYTNYPSPIIYPRHCNNTNIAPATLKNHMCTLKASA